jgi:hypothetical protein
LKSTRDIGLSQSLQILAAKHRLRDLDDSAKLRTIGRYRQAAADPDATPLARWKAAMLADGLELVFGLAPGGAK